MLNEVKLSDAEAYNYFVSSAVDFKFVFERKGVVSATRSVRDIDTNSRRLFIYNIPLPSGNNSSTSYLPPPVELPTKIKARIPSPSGLKIAVLVEEDIPTYSGVAGCKESTGGKRQVFEIWSDHGHRLANRIPLSPEMHGKVCTDFEWFGGISWSPDEIALVYSADVNKPKTFSYFSESSSSDSEGGGIAGGQFTLGLGKSEDWGEKYGSTALLALFCLNVETGKIGLVENVPGSSLLDDNVSTEGGYVLGQPIFSPCGKSVVYTGWDAGGGGEMPKRLGAIYCYQRPCKIYSSPVSKLLRTLSRTDKEEPSESSKNKDQPYSCITTDDRLARSPRFSKPNGNTSTMVYLCNTKGYNTHNGCMAMHACVWEMSEGSVRKGSTRIVVDVVSMPGDRGDTSEIAGIKFPGIFVNQLSQQCFSPDGKYVFTTTQWGSVTKVLSILIDGGSLSPVKFDLSTDGKFNPNASHSFLCFTDGGGAIVTQSEPNRPTVLGHLQPSFLGYDLNNIVPSEMFGNMHQIRSSSFSSISPESCIEASQAFNYEILNSEPTCGEVVVPIGGILLFPEMSKNEKLPLIVVPHGGPHSCTSTNFVPSYSFLCRQGKYIILHINYRGSTGFGQSSVESLAGNAGSLDVLDVVAATSEAIASGFVDPNRIGICGGSHGGFLAGHCIGQYPEIFKAAAVRNPVVNMASMVTATDIPDWCYIEALGLGSYNFSEFNVPNKHELTSMWDKSPIAHLEKVRAPTLIGLGMNDRRVPPSQGLEYYHSLRAKSVPTKLLIYDDCDHAIDGVASEADFWINTKRWFDTYL